MRISKKILITGVLCVVVLGAALGGFAIANAADDGTANSNNATQTNLWDKVAEMYQKDTGTAIDPAALQKAFEEAGTAIRTDKMDQMIQAMVDAGKITQAQADEWKAWLDSRPGSALTDEYKAWLEARPDIPGLFGAARGGMMPFGGMHRFGVQGSKIDPGVRGICPNIPD